MAALTAAQLREYLQVMKDLGVRKFHWGELYVELGPQDATEARPVPTRAKAEAMKTLFENPSLWPGGAPPKFPGQE